MSSTNRLELCNDSTKDGLTLNRSRAGIPRLTITGSRNDLDYYSSDGEAGNDGDDDHALGSGGVAGGLMMALRGGHRFSGGLGGLRRRKAGLVIPESALPATTDVLGSIMNEQERWMTMSNAKNINKIKIKADGRLEYEGDNLPSANNNNSVNVRGAAAAAAAGSTDNSTTSNVGASSSSNSNNNQPPSSAGSSSQVAGMNNGTSGSGTSTGASSLAVNGAPNAASGSSDVRTAAARKAPPDAPVVKGE